MLWPFGAALAFLLSISGGIVVYLYLKATTHLMRGIS
jgi:hypothetical protein